MKTSMTLLVLLLALSSWGCAKKSAGDAASSGMTDGAPIVDIPDEPFDPDEDGPGQGPGSNWQYGATANLKIVNLARMSDYTGRPMNEAKNPKINVNLRQYGDGYGGTISIAYNENGARFEGNFTSGNTEKSTQYNVWFKKSGKNVFHGFFEDFRGGLVVVIDKLVDLGDGVDVDSMAGGSVWYKNFGLTYAPNPLTGYLPGFGRPQTFCWFISLGPYDCRAWKTDRGVNTTAAVLPDNGYLRLGNFNGLNLEEAFNGDLVIK